MSKYIDACDLQMYMRTMLTGNDLYTPNGIDKFVDSLPAADVVKRVYRGRRPSDDLVEVVRCKDCKHADLFYPYCTIWEAAIDGDGYCYKGEKEDGVRYGRWIPTLIMGDRGSAGYSCSVCHKFNKTDSDSCPNCGAKMVNGDE